MEFFEDKDRMSEASAEASPRSAAENTESVSPSAGQKKQKTPKPPVRISLSIYVVSLILTALLVFQATFVPMALSRKNEVRRAYGVLSSYPKLLDVQALYEKEYLYDVNAAEMDESLTRMYIAASGDRFASYYTAEEWAEEYAASVGVSSGIGIYANLDEDGNVLVIHVMSGSPAEQAGVLAGDVFLKIEGQPTREIGYYASLNLVKGEAGTKVTVDILRDGQTLTLEIVRGSYHSETVVTKYLEQDGKLICRVRILEFEKNTVEAFRKAVTEAMSRKADGIIFDLRDNPGGDLDVVAKVLDMLLPEGPIVHLLDVNRTETDVLYSDKNEINYPMTVLVNGSTASAAELFSSALRDYNKASLIGTTTFGKGCGQRSFQLRDGSVLFLTNFLYTPPFSENYDGVGLTPDIPVELPESIAGKHSYLLTEAEDTQLQAAIGEIINLGKQ